MADQFHNYRRKLPTREQLKMATKLILELFGIRGGLEQGFLGFFLGFGGFRVFGFKDV